MQRVKMQNPGPASLVLVNPKRVMHVCSVCGKGVGQKGYCAKHPNATVDSISMNGGKTMAARKRSTRGRPRRRAAVNPKRRRSTAVVRSRRTTSAFRAPAKRRTKRRNPLMAVKRLRGVSRRRNPVSGAIGQAIPLVGASFAITFAAPFVTGIAGRFLPLGQFTQPVVLAGTGYGLSWLAGKLGFAKYRGPLEIMGVTLGLTALVAPYLRGFLTPSQPAQGMAGRNGMRGIAAIPSIPPQIQAARAQAANNAGMKGIASYQAPGRFGR